MKKAKETNFIFFFIFFLAFPVLCCFSQMDMQAQLGGMKSFATFCDLEGQDESFSQAGMSFCFELNQLFPVKKHFSLGFYGNFYYTGEYRQFIFGNDYYSAYTAGLSTGPSCGFVLNSLFKFQGNLGLLLGYRTYDTPVYEYGNINAFSRHSAELEDKWTFGFATSIMAKCFYDYFISPIAGVRYMYTYCDVFSSDVFTHSFIFFTGMCFNIGARR